MPSKKLEIIYYNGQPDGIRSIRKHLSTMTTYVTVSYTHLVRVYSPSEVNVRPPIS